MASTGQKTRYNFQKINITRYYLMECVIDESILAVVTNRLLYRNRFRQMPREINRTTPFPGDIVS